jgi:hypothetical protein
MSEDLSVHQKISQLRELLGTTLAPSQSPEPFPFSALPECGIPRGALIEISGPAGSGKSELALQFLAEVPQLRAAWVEDEFTVYPCAFPQAGISLNRILFSQGGSDSIWVALQILSSQLFGVVILKTRLENEIDLRRLQLCAEKSRSSLIVLSDSPRLQGNWTFQLQLEVQRHPQTRAPQCRIIKCPSRILTSQSAS